MADDADLIEQIAQKLHEVDPISGHDPRWDRLLKMDREWYRIKAAAVLPIIRKAQAAAWDGATLEACVAACGCLRGRDVPNPYREEQDR